MTGGVSLRQMAPEDIPAGLRFCRASGWNQLEADWRLFLDASPTGCRVAVSEGRVVGTVATLRFEQRFSWVSMVLVEPESRGRGIGSMLFEDSLRILHDMETVRLDATPAGKIVYDRFAFQDEYHLVRMRRPKPAEPERPSGPSRATPIAAADLPRIFALDREVFGADRSPILAGLYQRAPEYAWLVESASGIEGFVFGRHGFLAEHIGPIVAADETVARELVNACLANGVAAFLLDAPRHTPGWLNWLESLGFRAERPFIRMFRGSNAWPGLPGRQFAIAGPELG